MWTKSNKRAHVHFVCDVTWFYFCVDFVRSHARCGCCFIVCRRKFSLTSLCIVPYMKHSKIKSILNKKAVKKIWNSKCKSFACSHFFSLVKVFSFVNILFKNDSLHIVQFLEGRRSETYPICGFGRCYVSNENKRPIQYVF